MRRHLCAPIGGKGGRDRALAGVHARRLKARGGGFGAFFSRGVRRIMGLRSVFALAVLTIIVFTCPRVAVGQERLIGNPLNEPVGDPGTVPAGNDGSPLNLNFEKGTLEDWTLEGKAFEGQPIQGEI